MVDYTGHFIACVVHSTLSKGKAPWPSGRASDSEARSRVRSSLRSPCCILEQDTFTSQKVLVIPRKRWLHSDMTEKLLTGT